MFIQGSSAPEFTINANSGTVAAAKASYTLPTNLSFLTIYEIKVDAGAYVDANGNSSTELTWYFTTADNVAPTITFTPTASTAKGSTPKLSPVVTDNSGTVQNVTLHYRKISASAFSTIAATADGSIANKYNVDALPAYFDETGMEYYFTATDQGGNEGRSPAGTDTYKMYLTFTGADAVIPSARLGFGGTKEGWKVFSIPYELGTSNAITTIFNELDGLTNKVDYRFLKFKDLTAWGEFPTDFSTINRGEGYFINIKTAKAITIADNLTAPTNSRTNLYQMSLKKGWNMIGNPYLSNISWNDVSTYNSLSGTDAILVKYSAGRYVITDKTLAAFEGGFVFATDAKTISIPFEGQVAAGSRKEDVIFGQGDWIVPVTVKQGDAESVLGGFGMHKLANHSFDQFDRVSPPRFFTYAEVNFKHEEHFAANFSFDVVNTQSNYSWEFTVASNASGNGELVWDNTMLAGIQGDLYLFDVGLQKPINMRTTTHYSYNLAESSRFRVYFGDAAKHEFLAGEPLLGQAYPNPTDGKVTIGISLPEEGGNAQQVELQMIDALGRSLGNAERQTYPWGYHELVWNGQDKVSGQGFITYRIKVSNNKGQKLLQGKLIVNK